MTCNNRRRSGRSSGCGRLGVTEVVFDLARRPNGSGWSDSPAPSRGPEHSPTRYTRSAGSSPRASTVAAHITSMQGAVGPWTSKPTGGQQLSAPQPGHRHHLDRHRHSQDRAHLTPPDHSAREGPDQRTEIKMTEPPTTSCGLSARRGRSAWPAPGSAPTGGASRRRPICRTTVAGPDPPASSPRSPARSASGVPQGLRERVHDLPYGRFVRGHQAQSMYRELVG